MADQLLDFGDIEALAIAPIKADFEASFVGVAVGTQNAKTPEYLKLTASGGVQETLITENPRILLEAYAATEVRAIAILNRARAVLRAQSNDGTNTLFGFTSVSLPTNLPDPRTEQIRYTSLVGVRVRGAVTS